MNPVPIFDNTSVVQRVIDYITSLLIQREVLPGQKIPTEVELVARLGASRNTIREAIKILVYLGILEIRRADGTYVCQGFSPKMVNPIIYGIIIEDMNSESSLGELRELIETGVIRLAMAKRTEEELKELDLALEHFREVCADSASTADDIFAADNAFHQVIITMGHNDIVDAIFRVSFTLLENQRRETVKQHLIAHTLDSGYQAHKDIRDLIYYQDWDSVDKVVPRTFFWGN